MELIKCSMAHLDMVSAMYGRVVKYLEETINYPKWSKQYPCRESVKDAIQKKEQYACMESGRVLGAAVLNENPDGNYEAGEWSRKLKRGEYLVIHTLAADPLARRKGIGGYLVSRFIEIAKEEGYQAIRIDVVPGNLPAINLYRKKGFAFAGARDLLRDIEEIPIFELYECNILDAPPQALPRSERHPSL